MDSFLKDAASDTLHRLCRPISFLTPDLIVAPPSWLGHTPFALWIIDALRPRTFVELGTHTGNSYSAFCQAVKQLELATACFAVDTWQGDPQAGYYGDEVYRTLAEFHDPRYGAFSRMMRMTFDEAAVHFSDGGVDLLHIDGLHTYEAVRHDFETWAPKMSGRGVVLFHDINVRKGDFGVWKLWEELSARYPSFGFLHSNGLGVLGVGDDLPDEVRWLFEAGRENGERPQQIRAFFDRLGSGVIETQQAQERARRILGLEQDVAGLHETVRGRVDEIRDLMGTVAARNESIATLQEWIAGRDAHIVELGEQIGVLGGRIEALRQEGSDLRRQLDDAQAEAERLRLANDELHGVVRARDHHIHSLVNSTSWKVSAPVRKLGRLSKELRRFHRSCRHAMALEPMHDVARRDDGSFETHGVDPAFRLVSDQGRCPHGWCVITYRVADATVPLAPLLYIDCGAGFGEGVIVRLPPVVDGEAEALVLLPYETQALRLDPTDRPARFRLEGLTIQEIGKLQVLQRALKTYQGQAFRGLTYLRQHGLAATKHKLLQDLQPNTLVTDYESWIRLYDTLTPFDRQSIAEAIGRMARRPLISVVMPVYNTPEPYLRRAIDTVLEQLYPHWELCIADDASTAPHVAAVLAEYAGRDPRIKTVRRETNGHISAASNTALELASGEFVALMDHDDELPPHALYMAADEINRHPDADVIYSDEDKIDENGRRYDPYFKTDWNPDLFHGQNMVSHLGVFRRTLLTEIGGFRVGYEGSQDYDLVLRAVEKTTAARVRHIPMILYHWRVFSASSSFSTVALPTATDAARRALQDHFQRIALPVTVTPAPGAEWYTRVVYPVPEPAPLVSLLVPTRDKVDLLRQCVEGLLDETDYRNIEVLILDNNSEEKETLDYFASLEGRDRVRVLRYDGPFNFSAINNFGVRAAKGELIGLINNDIKIIGPGWLTEMVGHALRPEVGAVGAKLYYGDDTVQHAGVITGINGVANHIHKHFAREHPGHFARLMLTQNMSCVTAACMVMRKAVFEEVGGLEEEHLAVAFNDVDLCLRVRDAGYFLVWTPHAELYHLESASRGSDMAPDKIARFKREIAYMHERWGKALVEDPFYNPNLTLETSDFGLAFPPRTVKPWLLKERQEPRKTLQKESI
ncbi:glycosyltransferase [Azospirillum sp. TSO35-2]|uniref:glycosyltransferase family 2 protein n=1 Tax=Azospirillum sp. TSO35-2 TaxID=716796 RepID=UPI001304DF64|nr:glycosyltransferase [Azospirillum sp. TSO35-2]